MVIFVVQRELACPHAAKDDFVLRKGGAGHVEQDATQAEGHAPEPILAVERRAGQRLCGRFRTQLDVRASKASGSRAPQRVVLCVRLWTRVHKVRTNIEIDDKLMRDALRATGAKTKREAVELGLKTLVQLRAQEKARELRGKIRWEGDLNAMRSDR